MKAILEVEFNSKDMCSIKELNKYYNGSWLKCMKFLFKSESIGIFDKEIKLVDVKNK